MEKFKSLIIGNPYTIMGFTLTGKPYFKRFLLVSIKDNSAGHYEECYTLTVKARITQTTLIKITHTTQFVIWTGWITPKIDTVNDYPDFSPLYLVKAKMQTHHIPIIEHINMEAGNANIK